MSFQESSQFLSQITSEFKQSQDPEHQTKDTNPHRPILRRSKRLSKQHSLHQQDEVQIETGAESQVVHASAMEQPMSFPSPNASEASEGQNANNNNNLSHNYLDGGMYVQSPKLMGIWLSVYCGNGYRCYLQPLKTNPNMKSRTLIALLIRIP